MLLHIGEGLGTINPCPFFQTDDLLLLTGLRHFLNRAMICESMIAGSDLGLDQIFLYKWQKSTKLIQRKTLQIYHTLIGHNQDNLTINLVKQDNN